MPDLKPILKSILEPHKQDRASVDAALAAFNSAADSNSFVSALDGTRLSPQAKRDLYYLKYPDTWKSTPNRSADVNPALQQYLDGGTVTAGPVPDATKSLDTILSENSPKPYKSVTQQMAAESAQKAATSEPPPLTSPQSTTPQVGSGLPGSFTAEMTAESGDEAKFQQWYKQYAAATGNDPNPDAKEHYYDYRGFYKQDQGKTPITSGMHLPDTFKRPGHPTFSNESQYATGENAKLAGQWQGETFVPPAPAQPAPIDPRITQFIQGIQQERQAATPPPPVSPGVQAATNWTASAQTTPEPTPLGSAWDALSKHVQDVKTTIQLGAALYQGAKAPLDVTAKMGTALVQGAQKESETFLKTPLAQGPEGQGFLAGAGRRATQIATTPLNVLTAATGAGWAKLVPEMASALATIGAGFGATGAVEQYTRAVQHLLNGDVESAKTEAGGGTVDALLTALLLRARATGQHPKAQEYLESVAKDSPSGPKPPKPSTEPTTPEAKVSPETPLSPEVKPTVPQNMESLFDQILAETEKTLGEQKPTTVTSQQPKLTSGGQKLAPQEKQTITLEQEPPLEKSPLEAAIEQTERETPTLDDLAGSYEPPRPTTPEAPPAAGSAGPSVPPIVPLPGQSASQPIAQPSVSQPPVTQPSVAPTPTNGKPPNISQTPSTTSAGAGNAVVQTPEKPTRAPDRQTEPPVPAAGIAPVAEPPKPTAPASTSVQPGTELPTRPVSDAAPQPYAQTDTEPVVSPTTGEADKGPREYASTQANLPAGVAAEFGAFHEKIDPADLADDGIETEPHITVKFGIHDDSPETIEKVRQILSAQPPIHVTFGKTSVFPASGQDGSDVVKVDIDSEDLKRINKLIKDAIPNTDTHPDYTPHATVAYVKPGMGEKYAGDDHLEGQEILLHSIAFSTKDRNAPQVEIPLQGESETDKNVRKALDERAAQAQAEREKRDQFKPGVRVTIDKYPGETAPVSGTVVRVDNHGSAAGSNQYTAVVKTSKKGTVSVPLKNLSIAAEPGSTGTLSKPEEVQTEPPKPVATAPAKGKETVPPEGTKPESPVQPPPVSVKPEPRPEVNTSADPEFADHGRPVRVTTKIGKETEVQEGKIARTLKGTDGTPVYEVDFGDGPVRLGTRQTLEFLDKPEEPSPEPPRPVETDQGPVPDAKTPPEDFTKFKDEFWGSLKNGDKIQTLQGEAKVTNVEKITMRPMWPPGARSYTENLEATLQFPDGTTKKYGSAALHDLYFPEKEEETKPTSPPKPVSAPVETPPETEKEPEAPAAAKVYKYGLQEPVKRYHSQRRQDIWVVQKTRKNLTNDEYARVSSAANAEGGKWTKAWRPTNTPEGFVFTSEAAAHRFLDRFEVKQSEPPKAVAPKPQESIVEEEEEQSHGTEEPPAQSAGEGDQPVLAGEPPRPVSEAPTERKPGAKTAGSTGGGSGPSRRPDDQQKDEPRLGSGSGPRVVHPEEKPVTEEEAPPKKEPVEHFTPAKDYRITEADEIGKGGVRAKIKGNVAAIKLLRDIESEGRDYATPEEQAVLVKYVGWGQTWEVFDAQRWNDDEGLYTLQQELKKSLSEDEYASARASSKNAHYTDPMVIDAIWDGLKRLGATSGMRWLEPSAGVGHFYGLMPEDLAAHAKRSAVEKDEVSGKILKMLYPHSDTHISGFEDVPFPDNFFDVAVSNIPFGNYGVHDPKFKNKPFLTSTIHNYFFAKALDKVRPGGVVAFVTSRYTLDSTKAAPVRRYIADQADFLGAMRLPSTAFEKNAGTKVVTDIIFLRKRMEGEKPTEMKWVDSKETSVKYDNEDWSDRKHINEYFIDHPEMILGDQRVGRGMRNATEVIVKGNLTSEQLSKAMEVLPKGVLKPPKKDPKKKEPVITNLSEEDFQLKDGSYSVKNGKIVVRKGTTLQEVPLGKDPTERAKGLIGLRDAAREVLRTQVADETPQEQEAARDELNRQYDAFVKKNGPVSLPKNRKILRSDPDYPLIIGLEDFDADSGTAKKTKIFSETVVHKYVPPTSAGSVEDALAISLNEYGSVDMDRIGELTGKTPAEIEAELAGQIYRDPEAGEEWQTADEYLSGNVRSKLRAAEAAARYDKKYEGNVEALKAVQPKDLTAEQIKAHLGAPWVPKEDIRDFVGHLLNAGYKSDITISHIPAIAHWKVEGDAFIKSSVVNRREWGVAGKTALDLINDTLNHKLPKVYARDIDGKPYVDKVKTIAAREKQSKIKEEFQKWLWSDKARSQKLTDQYNEEYNSDVRREHNGDYLVLPGMNRSILRDGDLMKHQKTGVSRIIRSKNNTLLAHCVGSGKSYELIAGGMELKRLGLAKKNCYVVPNASHAQFVAQFKALYPTASIFSVDEESWASGKRQEAMARIATGNFDAVIFPTSSFQKLPISDEAFIGFMNEQLRELYDLLESTNRDEKSTIKELEKQVARIEKRLKDRRARERQDDTLTFEEMGFDSLFVDESDQYKNLSIITRMERVAGLVTSESDRAMDMFLKTRHISKINNGRGVIFATGTPISNSMSEMYNVQRYLDFDALKEHGLEHFDAWAQNFGEVIPTVEMRPDGDGFRTSNRFAKFSNLPELISMFHKFADVKTADMLDLPRPKIECGGPQPVVVESTPWLEQYKKYLIERAKAIQGQRPEKGADNILVIMMDGQKAAIDPRMIDDSLPDDPRSKLNITIKNVFDIWQDTKEEGLTQAVFLDSGIFPQSTKKKHTGDDPPEHLNTFSAYDEIKRKLILMGVPEDEIILTKEFDKEEGEAIFKRVREGKARIVIGSTGRLGVGVNIQNKLYAMHHVDAPYRPRDMEQRNGRGERQGNENEEIKIFYYGTENTLDARRYDLLSLKAKFINALMKGDTTVREMDDIDIGTPTYSEMMAAFSGNPLIMERVKVESEIRRLDALASEHESGKWSMRNEIAFSEGRIPVVQYEIEQLRKDIATRDANQSEEFKITLRGKEFTGKEGRAEAAKELNQIRIDRAAEGTATIRTIGAYKGFELIHEIQAGKGGTKMFLQGQKPHGVNVNEVEPLGTLASIEATMRNLDKKLAEQEGSLELNKSKIDKLRLEIDKPFEKQGKLDDLLIRLAEIEKELGIGQDDNQALTDDGREDDNDGDDDTEPPRSQRRPVSDDSEPPPLRSSDFSAVGTEPPTSGKEAIPHLRFWLRHINESASRIRSGNGTDHDLRVMIHAPIVAMRLANWIELKDDARWKREHATVEKYGREALHHSIAVGKYYPEYANKLVSHYAPNVADMALRLANFDKGLGFVDDGEVRQSRRLEAAGAEPPRPLSEMRQGSGKTPRLYTSGAAQRILAEAAENALGFKMGNAVSMGPARLRMVARELKRMANADVDTPEDAERVQLASELHGKLNDRLFEGEAPSLIGVGPKDTWKDILDSVVHEETHARVRGKDLHADDLIDRDEKYRAAHRKAADGLAKLHYTDLDANGVADEVLGHWAERSGRGVQRLGLSEAEADHMVFAIIQEAEKNYGPEARDILGAAARRDRQRIGQEPPRPVAGRTGQAGVLDGEGPEGKGLGTDAGDSEGEADVGEPPRLMKTEPGPIPDALTGPFYSALQRTIERKMGGTMPSEQLKAMLSNPQSGVKKDELIWTGMLDFLDANAGKKVTKAQVLEHLKQNDIRVEEVLKGNGRDRSAKLEFIQDSLDDDMWYGKLRHSNGQWDNTYFKIYSEHGRYVATLKKYEQAPIEMGQYYSIPEAKVAITEYLDYSDWGDLEPVTQTKYNKYVQPFSQDDSYRELLLTLPPQPPSEPARLRELKKKYDAWENVNGPAFTSEEIHEMMDLNNDQMKRKPQTPYTSGHFDEPNIFAHVRFDERTDADGKRTLMIQEIQSDWSQQGRDKGWIDKDKKYTIFDMHTGREVAKFSTREEAEKYVKEHAGEGLDFDNDFSAADSNYQKLPKHPFMNNWETYALRRMIRWAAENGYDQIAWTTGEQQIERYPQLATLVNSIDYRPLGETTELWILSADGHDVHDQIINRVAGAKRGSDGSVLVPRRQVVDVVGKELSDKIEKRTGEWDAEEQTYSLKGLNLKMGGEGMRAAYDSRLVNIANDIGKRFGVRVGKTKLGTEQEVLKKLDGDWILSEISSGRADDLSGSYESAMEAFESDLEDDREISISDTFVFSDNSGNKYRVVASSDGYVYVNTEPLDFVWRAKWTESKKSLATVHALPISEAMRRSVLHEGQPRFKRHYFGYEEWGWISPTGKYHSGDQSEHDLHPTHIADIAGKDSGRALDEGWVRYFVQEGEGYLELQGDETALKAALKFMERQPGLPAFFTLDMMGPYGISIANVPKYTAINTILKALKRVEKTSEPPRLTGAFARR